MRWVSCLKLVGVDPEREVVHLKWVIVTAYMKADILRDVFPEGQHDYYA
jgi:hypothetical protein